MKAAGGLQRGAGVFLAALAGAWLAGIALHLQLSQLPPPAATFGAATLAAVAMPFAWRGAAGRWLVLPIVGLLAFAWASWLAQQRLAEMLPSVLEGQDVELVGVVAALPRRLADGVRFTFEIERAAWRGRPVVLPTRVSLAWYRHADDGVPATPMGEPQAGERWQLTARLRAPHGPMNPHGFDHELWLFEQGIRASGYVRTSSGTPPRRLQVAAGYAVERLRQHVRDAVFARVADSRAAGVIAGLAIGDQASIERADWDLFRRSGTAHLVAISGLHVTMFAWAVGALVGGLCRRSTRLMLRLPAPLAARVGGVAAAAAYALLAGWGVPAQRTVWMLATAALLGLAGLRWPWPLVLVAAAVVVTAADPWALLQPGFWLSFAAVGLLMASEPARAAADAPPPTGWRRLAAPLRAGLRTQVVAAVGLAPLTLVLFQQVSLVGLLANLVAIPLVTLLITPLSLLGSVLPPLWTLAAWLVSLLTQLLSVLVAAPAAVWTAAAAAPWAQVGGLLAALLLVLPLPWRLRALALPLLAPLLWPPVERPAAGRFELLAVDVGQGSAVLVRTQGHTLLYDAGARYSRDTDAGQRVLVPLLHALGERRLDALVLSHRDSDHVGGAAAVMAALPVTHMVSSLPPDHELLAAGVPHRRCEAGQGWSWDGVRFELQHPTAADHDRPLKPNALSCVLHLADAQGRSVLLTGDIESPQEAALVARTPAATLRSDVLLAPHHGSRSSSSALLLDAVAPQRVVVQAGYRNRYGHPADEVLARYAERAIVVERSDRCGAWRWDGEVAACERERRRRYWHWRPGIEQARPGGGSGP